jgi:hypothetical protein
MSIRIMLCMDINMVIGAIGKAEVNFMGASLLYPSVRCKAEVEKAAIPNLNLTISTQSRQDAKILTFPRRNRQEYHLAQGQS